MRFTRTHHQVGNAPVGKHDAHTPLTAAAGIEVAIRMLEGRWKLVILFNLFGGRTLRFSELERTIPAISQKVLVQQLRQLEHDGIVERIVHPQVPPKVEYRMTAWGQSLCPALDSLLSWATQQPIQRSTQESVQPE
jgi:DNA-binding HxlR family transcriptional regulator